MQPACDFCGEARAVIYCKADSARLCLHCDGCVHSANFLSLRHPRSLLCDKCNSQPATVRCLDEKLSACQSCDSTANGCSSLGHRLHPLNFYTGCPSLADISKLFSPILEAPSSNGCDLGWGQLGSVAMPENRIDSCLQQWDNEGIGLVNGKLNDLEPGGSKFEACMGPPGTILQNQTQMPCSREQAPFLPQDINITKGCSNLKDFGLHDDDDLCEGLNMDDIQLNFDNGDDEIFGCSQLDSKYQFEDAGKDCILLEKNMSVTESNGPVDNAIEVHPNFSYLSSGAMVSSSGQQDCAGFQSSCVSGSTSAMHAITGNSNSLFMNPSCNRNINLGFPGVAGQVHSSISLPLSNIIGESSAADYQDCGLSPLFLTGESPWESHLEASCPQARDKAKIRYNEKKKTRTASAVVVVSVSGEGILSCNTTGTA
ncbi:hypothetical protein Tsubulata_033176 [Turnera subulata]|uniref:B box-type domain-containing protein n=1 Tax=Turnera subulata TaxID=218843 RepID=A0A9Q0FHR0_9ROSI|nr:hypothetical protein Tsubulata_033176 [Turnera subulata]